MGFEITGTYQVTVDSVVYTPIGYDGSINYEFNANTGQVIIHVKETIIFVDGELEITVKDTGPSGGPYLGTFVGIGKGSLQGVKVSGTTFGDGVTLTRTGTIMGWP